MCVCLRERKRALSLRPDFLTISKDYQAIRLMKYDSKLECEKKFEIVKSFDSLNSHFFFKIVPWGSHFQSIFVVFLFLVFYKDF